jgi:hypothetical protein
MPLPAVSGGNQAAGSAPGNNLWANASGPAGPSVNVQTTQITSNATWAAPPPQAAPPTTDLGKQLATNPQAAPGAALGLPQQPARAADKAHQAQANVSVDDNAILRVTVEIVPFQAGARPAENGK